MKVVEDVFPLCLQIGLPEAQSVQQALHQDCQLSVKEVGFKWEFLLRNRAWLSVFGLQKVRWSQNVFMKSLIFQNTTEKDLIDFCPERLFRLGLLCTHLSRVALRIIKTKDMYFVHITLQGRIFLVSILENW